MPRKVSRLAAREQPIHWKKAIFCGIISAIFMSFFVDTFYLMGITPFSFEYYLGSLIRQSAYGTHNWTVGFLANFVVGGLFGTFYAYFFEYVFFKADARAGVKVALWHAFVAAIFVFPFFNAIHEFSGTGVYPNFGFFGLGLGLPTAILLLTGHLLYGMCMGLFYGPVRVERVRARYFEPGEVGLSAEEGGISKEEDAEDRVQT